MKLMEEMEEAFHTHQNKFAYYMYFSSYFFLYRCVVGSLFHSDADLVMLFWPSNLHFNSSHMLNADISTTTEEEEEFLFKQKKKYINRPLIFRTHQKL